MLILLTACIRPEDNVPILKIKSAEVRLAQYKESLNFWLEKTKIDKIVFCDNSNYDLSTEEFIDLAKKNNKQIEFLKFQGSTREVIDFGKGYGEGEILKFFIENSKLLVNEDYFFKVTGRVKIENFNEIYELIKTKPQNYFNSNKIFDRRQSANTVFFLISTDVYKKYLLNIYQEVRDLDGIVLEKLVRRELLENRIYSNNFPIYPMIDGMAAGPGIPYPKNPERNWYRKYFCKLGFYKLREW